ncbi:hypothetical protein [Carboxydothermus hydrogenoformans]|uniref:Uncharacterized protein n=1 Tax=Carboxydothermus hydrogenoformans (strain ATCC BAA-161 / DSM 6008 / Z-2901) TaxID=246194 RepID=Q3ACB7_CARHZ|nr:hypothetical protein [Carboxydothermus hydrogenoformans]ABB16088.1 hypothetical protein CHY_1385 [Carboxydothermus hydrogenoformans Z-2901]
MKEKFFAAFKFFFIITFFLFGLCTSVFAGEKPVVRLNHLFLAKNGSNLNVQQILQIDIPQGYKEQHNGKVVEVFLPLPQGFTDLNVSGIKEEQYIRFPDGLGLTTGGLTAVKLSINYSLPFADKKSLILYFPYSCDVFAVLTTPGEFTINSGELTPQGVLEINGKSFDVYATGNLKENTKITLNLTAGQGNWQKAPQIYSEETTNLKFHSPEHIQRWKNSPLGNTDPHLWLVFLLLVIGGIVVALVMLYRSKHESLDDEEFLEKVKQLKAQEQEILAKVELLEEKYGKAEVTEEEYQELLNNYKEQLKKIKIELKKLSE